MKLNLERSKENKMNKKLTLTMVLLGKWWKYVGGTKQWLKIRMETREHPLLASAPT